MSKPVPVWAGTIDRDGVLRLDSTALFRRFCTTLKNQAVQVTVKKLSRRKSQNQLGFIWGVCYPVIADELGYRSYEVEEVHDALMRRLRGLKPEPNPLQLRVSLREMTHEEVSAYIEDLRFFAVQEWGIVIPDPEKAEAA
jgi:hypothetical protein